MLVWGLALGHGRVCEEKVWAVRVDGCERGCSRTVDTECIRPPQFQPQRPYRRAPTKTLLTGSGCALCCALCRTTPSTPRWALLTPTQTWTQRHCLTSAIATIVGRLNRASKDDARNQAIAVFGSSTIASSLPHLLKDVFVRFLPCVRLFPSSDRVLLLGPVHGLLLGLSSPCSCPLPARPRPDPPCV